MGNPDLAHIHETVLNAQYLLTWNKSREIDWIKNEETDCFCRLSGTDYWWNNAGPVLCR